VQTHRQADRQSDNREADTDRKGSTTETAADKFTYKKADRQTDRQADRHVVGQKRRHANWQRWSCVPQDSGVTDVQK